MSHQADEQRKAVECGYWPLYRYDPRRAEKGENPFQLDFKKLKGETEPGGSQGAAQTAAGGDREETRGARAHGDVGQAVVEGAEQGVRKEEVIM